MWKVAVTVGVVFTAVALFYFIRLAYYLLNAYEFTDYGYGYLTGNAIILLTGLLLLRFGFKMKNKKKQHT